MASVLAVVLVAVLVGMIVQVSGVSPARAAAGPCGPPVVNQVACENSQPGTPASQWDVSGAGSSTIQGFATDISVNVGQTVHFKIKTPAQSYRLDIYRMGYYQGLGARLIAGNLTPTAALPQTQPACLTNGTTGLFDCGNWAESASWAVPASAVSGIYLAKLTRTDGTTGTSHIVFVVRNDASHSDLLFQTSDSTWQAYNNYGGNSLYVGSPAGRAYKVSYNRPFNTRSNSTEDFVFNSEYPMVRFLEANGYDVSYFTDVDSDRNGVLIKQHKTFLSVGHDEYWSGGQRANVTAARDAGVNLAFFSGNESFWKTRWETSTDSSHTANRTLVCYKETHANAVIDPADPPTWTGTWRDPRFSPPADGGRPENALTGTIFMVNGERTDAIQVPSADGKLRFWRNTAEASLAPGAVAALPTGTLGYEWDEDLDNGFRPPGTIDMSTTTLDVSPDLLVDYGSTYGTGTATHHLTLYRAASGARVFGAGTVQWPWGLDATHDRSGPAADNNMRQATVNLLADMGAQPATLVNGLTVATASTDSAPPTSSITAPAAGSSVQAGGVVTISGTASDTGGGTVGGVEVSTDGGQTWHPASGRGSWSYTWVPAAVGTATIKSRATDDSGNIETPGPGRTVTVTARSCPCTIWSNGTIPGTPSDTDPSAIEVGVKFRSDTAGTITGLRFYKGSGNTGTHVGHLWTSTGALLASATFSGETASGWQQVNLSTPVTVAANTTYVASYHTDVGHYASNDGYFAKGVDNTPLHALASGVDGPNGVYAYGTSAFPTSSYQNSNYWVDVVFVPSGPDTTPPTVASTSPPSGATNVATGSSVAATFSEPVQPSTVNLTLTGPGGAAVAALPTSYNSNTQTETLTPTSPLANSTTYTATVAAGVKDLAGNSTTAPMSWSFRTAASSPTCTSCTIWAPNATPTVAADPDPAAVELGVKVRSDVAGYIKGIRFYKGATNTGTHVGNLWSSTGTKLATATFTGETASGWQHVSFSSPVAVNANTTYVASYHTSVGHYADDTGFFATSGVDNSPLHALADGIDGSNGVYSYGATSTFPAKAYQASNYWVDVVFSTTP